MDIEEKGERYNLHLDTLDVLRRLTDIHRDKASFKEALALIKRHREAAYKIIGE